METNNDIVRDVVCEECVYNENNGCYECKECGTEFDVCDCCGKALDIGEVRHMEYTDGTITHTCPYGCEEDEDDDIDEDEIDETGDDETEEDTLHLEEPDKI